eukprot:scaffold91570_cov34-Prasinocladus_malaysianus.AAC.2
MHNLHAMGRIRLATSASVRSNTSFRFFHGSVAYRMRTEVSLRRFITVFTYAKVQARVQDADACHVESGIWICTVRMYEYGYSSSLCGTRTARR